MKRKRKAKEAEVFSGVASLPGRLSYDKCLEYAAILRKWETANGWRVTSPSGYKIADCEVVGSTTFYHLTETVRDSFRDYQILPWRHH